MDDLNKEQKEAVLHNKGPLLIVAGAGTGKTTVITQRIVNLIEKGLAKPEEILAVTFTEKAAGEMEERVDQLLDIGYVDLWISTFHAFCERVLRDNALDVGLAPDFKILDETSAWLLARRNLDKFNLDYYKALGNPTKFIQALISHFSHCKDQGIYPEDYLKYAEDLKVSDDVPDESARIKEVAEAYHIYQQMILENGYLDFGDLINYCLFLFKKRPQVRDKYRKKFKHILVDEFQDTNWAQYMLIKVLAEPDNNLTVCADDDQAIYRWRGASFSNIIQFKKDFPKSAQISLVKNYRSCQNILDLAHKFIKANDPDRLEFVSKIDKKLVAEIKEQGIIEHISALTLDQEVSKVIKRIEQLKDKDTTYSDFAILVRANSAAVPFAKALERSGLPYQFLASRGLYTKPIVLDIISYFKLLDDYHEGTAVFRMLKLPFLEIPEQEIAEIAFYSKKKTRSMFEALQEVRLIKVSPDTASKADMILSMVKKHSLMAREKSVIEILVSFLEDSGYLRYLVNTDEREKIELLNQFHRRIKAFEEGSVEPTLKNFVEEISLELESGEEGKLEFDPDQGPDMVKIMTIHSAKGLEFKYVFLVNMVDKRFPVIERKDPIELPAPLIKDIKPEGDIHLQEERRICYVAMTRAKKGLFFTSALDYGGQRKKKLSRFMTEMGYEESEVLSEKELPKIKPKQKPEYKYTPEHFSFSQLAAFDKCPLQYKLAFVLRIPTRGKPVFSFGKTIHAVLHSFLKNDEQKTLFGSAKRDDTKLLNELYERSWIDEWYGSKKEKEEYYNLGKKILKDFYKDYKENPPKVLRINNEPALELPFNLKIGEYSLYGVIDRIDEGGQIIDYKTGKAKDKIQTEDKAQLLIYQMAAEEVLGIKPKELTYYYLETGKKISFLGSEKDKSERKEKIIQAIKAIKESSFEPTPGWQCEFCDFKDVCDFKNV